MALQLQMRGNSGRLLWQAMLAFALLGVQCAWTSASGQHHGGAPAAGGFPRPGMPEREIRGGSSLGEGAFARTPNMPQQMQRNNMHMHGMLQVGPPGRWWDDKHFAKQLKLSEDQQRHMDVIFEQNRPMLLKRLEGLEQEEQRMEALTHAKALDEQALFAQIDRIEQARAELGKAALHVQVQLRNELDQDQISRLEDQH